MLEKQKKLNRNFNSQLVHKNEKIFKKGFNKMKGHKNCFLNHLYKIQFAFVERKLWPFEDSGISVGDKIPNPL